MRVRVPYSPEFRADAVALLRRSDRSIGQVADDIGVSDVTLRQWYKRDEMKKKSKARDKAPTASTAGVPKALLKGETPEERVARLERENDSLRRENDSLRMDREILKKAAAFFAKENE